VEGLGAEFMCYGVGGPECGDDGTSGVFSRGLDGVANVEDVVFWVVAVRFSETDLRDQTYYTTGEPVYTHVLLGGDEFLVYLYINDA
jgi:hypothetical protein